ncbi:hypothetical protein C8F01DRAFT_1108106 [Mycena amicta]|nr:hypothetical protein C8F01DRAFT_1108106 [Mycena amicta]
MPHCTSLSHFFVLPPMSLHQRLLDLEEEFVDASSTGDPDNFRPLLQKWTQLQSELKNASNSSDAVPEAVVQAIAEEISIFTGSLLALHEQADSQLDKLLGIDLDRPQAMSAKPKTNKVKPKPALFLRKDSSLPSYIEPAYKWLLRHLYDPYPSRAVKEEIANQSGCSAERVSEWFNDVRNRIGWTRLLREEFRRKRAAMCDVAARYFHPGSTNLLPPALQGRFAEIEVNAREIYANKFIPSPLSNKMAAAVKDMTPELRKQARSKAAVVYPTPVHSTASSPISDAGASTSHTPVESVDLSFQVYTPPDSPAPPKSRKRRLSETDASAPPKRPRHRHVSDPTPAPSPSIVTISGDPDYLANWFTTNEPAADLFDSATPLDISTFNPTEFNAFQEPLTPVHPPQVTTFVDASQLDVNLIDVLGVQQSYDCSLYPPESDPSFAPSDPVIYQHEDFVGFGNPNYFDSYIHFTLPPSNSLTYADYFNLD